MTAPTTAAKPGHTGVEGKFVWMDGDKVPWAEANVHIMTHSLHYGLAVFEGIRCYNTPRGPAAFRLDEHMMRLYRSAKICGLEPPYPIADLTAAVLDLLRTNAQPECYIRPIIYFGAGKFGLNNVGAPVRVAIATWKWGAYLGDEGLRRGIRACVSSFTRLHPNVMMTKAKCSGNYANSQMARVEAVRNGFDEAILLDPEGYVIEGSGENIFIVYGRDIDTPPLSSILDGITRDAVLRICEAEGLRVREARMSRDRLYCADEAFFTGTAAEVTPIREVDRRPIGTGEPGPVTRQLQGIFKRAAQGEDKRFANWVQYV